MLQRHVYLKGISIYNFGWTTGVYVHDEQSPPISNWKIYIQLGMLGVILSSLEYYTHLIFKWVI